jgi:hypothetical protein
MAFIGNILQEIGKYRYQKLNEKKIKATPFTEQEQQLRNLLLKAKDTEFGKHFNFIDILKSENLITAFKQKVAHFDYNKMYNDWWVRALNDLPNISWPGKIKYFALTSGTSQAASKKVPVSKEMIKAIQKTSLRQSISLTNANLSPKFFEKSVMMLGGCTKLNKVAAHYEGDLSGILIKNLPVWTQLYHKPGKEISAIRDWSLKIEKIVERANQWDVGIIAGVPAWYQLLFQKIIRHYKVDSIHDIWPNLQVYIHGGVAISPYEKSLRKYFNKEVLFIDTYLASEGFLGFQKADDEFMKLVVDNGIFFEFVPFNENNFDDNGDLKENFESLDISSIKENTEYAILISTCAGVWRYLIGDTIKFINTNELDFIITGRVKMFLSICGEHLSIDNLNHAVAHLSNEINKEIQEFTVYAMANGNTFKHVWYLGIDDYKPTFDLSKIIDEKLKELNDDYTTERKHVLTEVEVKVLPLNTFYEWMKMQGKFGGQNKFPRVLKGERIQSWEEFITKR